MTPYVFSFYRKKIELRKRKINIHVDKAKRERWVERKKERKRKQLQ